MTGDTRMKLVISVCLAFLFLGMALLLGIGFTISNDIKNITEYSQDEFSGGRIESLIALVDSEEHSLKKRRRAVWALGQLGDPRALPVLEKYYTGEPCNHKKFLCQRELERAIQMCKGKKINILAFLVR